MTINRGEAEQLRDRILEKLEEANIEARPLWKPLHLQPLFGGTPFYSHNREEVSVCEELFRKGICLPSGSSLQDEEQKRVIEVIRLDLFQTTVQESLTLT